MIAERLRQLDVLRGFVSGQLPALAIDLVFAVLFLLALFAINVLLGLVAVLAIPVLVAVSLADPSRPAAARRRLFQALAAKSSALTETVANAATVKALGLEAEVEKRWQARVEQRGGRQLPRRPARQHRRLRLDQPASPRPAGHRAGRRA